MLSAVLSITPGNFLAEKTWKTSEKQLARTGADPVLRWPVGVREPDAELGSAEEGDGQRSDVVDVEDGWRMPGEWGVAPTLTKFIFSLCVTQPLG